MADSNTTDRGGGNEPCTIEISEAAYLALERRAQQDGVDVTTLLERILVGTDEERVDRAASGVQSGAAALQAAIAVEGDGDFVVAEHLPRDWRMPDGK